VRTMTSLTAIQAYHRILEQPDMAQESWAVLSSRLRERHLVFGERPLCVVLRPLFYSPQEWEYLRGRTRLILRLFHKLAHAMRLDPALRRQIRLTPEEEAMIQVDPGYRTPIPTARLDSFFARQEDGSWTLHYVEFNGESPAGMAYTEELGELFLQIPAMQRLAQRYRLRLLRAKRPALDTILAIYHEWLGHRHKLPEVAIVDWRGVPTTSEFELFVEHFAAHGIRAVICDPEELEFRQGRLLAAGTPVDFVYKRVLVTELLQRYGLDHPLIHALRARAVCVMNPFACKLLHKKASLAVASDERNAHLLTPAEQQAVREHIPWTRLVEERTTQDPEGRRVDLLPWASQHREHLVLKPNDEYGGKGVVIGWEVDQTTWDAALQEALEHPAVIQQRATIAYEEFPALDEQGSLSFSPRLVDCDPFLFLGEKVEGCLTRLSSTTLLNVTAGGGSIVPVFLVEGR